jgi:hypothetical protein
MDDTSRRVGDDQKKGRAADTGTGRSDESVQGYGVTGEHQPSVTDAGVDERTTAIRRDIEQTREEMSETIEAIQDKLRPANIVSSATEKIKHATTERVREMTHSAGEAASNIMYGSRGRSGGLLDSIRDNPLPAALIGIGAAWMVMSSRSSNDTDSHPDSPYYGGRPSHRGRPTSSDWSGSAQDYRTNDIESGADYSRSAYPRGRSAYTVDRSTWSSGDRQGLLDRVKDNPIPAALAGIGLGWLAFAGESDRDDYDGPRGLYGQYDDGRTESTTMSQVSGSVSNAASDVADAAQRVASQTRELTQDATRRARQTGRRAQSELQRMTRDNPLAVSAGALLLGAIVGLAVPETERENELLGETRDSMLDKAQDLARTATSRAQDAAADLVSDAASRIVGGKSE